MQHLRTDVDRDPAAAWMQKLEALPPASTPLPSAEVLWWQAQALRRLDEQRRLTAKLEVGERIQAGCVIAGALALLAWMLSQVPQLWQQPAFVFASSVCSVMVLSAAVLVLWDERSGNN
jgi:hypothetical protein